VPRGSPSSAEIREQLPRAKEQRDANNFRDLEISFAAELHKYDFCLPDDSINTREIASARLIPPENDAMRGNAPEHSMIKNRESN